MIAIGSYNDLEIVRKVDFGVYLSDGEQDILLPLRQVPERAKQGDVLNVFVYTDSEDRPIATTFHPTIAAGQFGLLKIVSVSGIGAFADWGLVKDLLIPHAEQRYPLKVDRSYVVRALVDLQTNRVIGSTKLSKFLSKDTSELREGQEVEAIFTQQTEDGTMAIVDDRFFAAIFADEIFERLRVGERRKVFIKKIREDGQVSLSLSPQGFAAITSRGPEIVDMLRKAGGFLPYSDHTDPQVIRAVFGLSKSSFKKLIGGLMRDGTLEITYHGIRLKE